MATILRIPSIGHPKSVEVNAMLIPKLTPKRPLKPWEKVLVAIITLIIIYALGLGLGTW